MAYNISLLDNHTIEKKKYFFDANIWLMILKPPVTLKPYQKQYLDFVEKFMKSSQNPKIVIPSLILSEVINRYLRDVGMNIFIDKNGFTNVNSRFYKEIYRPSEQFKIDYELLCDDIKSYSKHYEFIPDKLGEEFKSKHILSSPPKGLDFNDHYYYLLAKKEKYSIVTDDGDFFVEDVEILTLNSTLYQKAKDSVKPKIN
jgi:PIN domain.